MIFPRPPSGNEATTSISIPSPPDHLEGERTGTSSTAADDEQQHLKHHNSLGTLVVASSRRGAEEKREEEVEGEHKCAG